MASGVVPASATKSTDSRTPLMSRSRVASHPTTESSSPVATVRSATFWTTHFEIGPVKEPERFERDAPKGDQVFGIDRRIDGEFEVGRGEGDGRFVTVHEASDVVQPAVRRHDLRHQSAFSEKGGILHPDGVITTALRTGQQHDLVGQGRFENDQRQKKDEGDEQPSNGFPCRVDSFFPNERAFRSHGGYLVVQSVP